MKRGGGEVPSRSPPRFLLSSMWIVLALLAASASAATSLLLKRAVGLAGVVVSTVAFRIIAGVLLALSCLHAEAWHALTPTYWRAVGVKSVSPPWRPQRKA